jgi:hypothetical protein
MEFLLVHSPLVGPATWRGVAEALVSLGHRAVVPDLRDAAATGDPREFMGAARSTVSRDTRVIVGHSGAGFFLPSIAAVCQEPVVLVFVDAGIPPCEGNATASADFIDQLRSIAVDGMLPPWSRWWDEGLMEHLVPDDDLRREIEAELPEVPLAFYETPIALPSNWCRARGFVLLSEGYRPDASAAASLGWPIVELLGGHLDVVNHPEAIARAVTSVASFSLSGSEHRPLGDDVSDDTIG